MKKLLSIMSTFTLIPALSVSVMSCTTHSSEDKDVIDVGRMSFTNIYVEVNNTKNLTQSDVDRAKAQSRESIQKDLLKYNKNANIDRDVRLKYDEHLINAPDGSNIYIYMEMQEAVF